MTETNDIREAVRSRYAAAATDGPETLAPCCAPQQFGASLYLDTENADDIGIADSLGCGVPTQVANLSPGETVLDLGSGAGGDALIAARRVGPDGKVYGLDMTDEMLQAARQNALTAGVHNIEFLKGYLEEIPLPDNTIDIALSNCVINLAADKRLVLAEAARVLKPGGRIAFSDVIAQPEMPDDVRADMEQLTGCIAGALTEEQFGQYLREAGFTDISIEPTHAVHEFANAAIIKANLRS